MELLGRYQPLFVVGRGGMGTIEVAVDGTRVVALKRMLPSVRDKRHTEMFMREARLATLLNHDNVVHAFAFGEQDGELVIAMEYVEGETLANVLGRRRLPIDVAAYVLAELCEGLHAAHELKDVTGAPLGVVHRDVSPHNVMLSYEGRVKLLDFGVAKLAASHLTKTGDVKGKTAYMSPEQAMGEPLDRRSDLYGVGAVLFELACGRRMWSGESDLEHLRQLALGEPPSLAKAAPEAPRALDELHTRLVAKKPADRPGSAAEVAAALRATIPEGADPRRALERMMQELYGEAMREKRRKLEAAMSGAEPAVENELNVAISKASPRAPSRVAPWMYALGGAAFASVAVFALARGRAPVTQSNAATTSASVPVSARATAQVALKTEPSATAPVEARISAPPQPRPSHVRTAPARTAPATTPAQPTPSATSAPPPRPPIDVDPNPI